MGSHPSHRILLILGLVTALRGFQSARILAVIPTAAYSHQFFYQRIWRELALRGHDVVVVTSDPTGETLPNLKEINIKEAYSHTKKFVNALVSENLFKLFVTNYVLDLINDMVDFELKLPQMQELIHNQSEHFDLILAEHFAAPHLAFQHRFNCPMIGVVSFDGFPQSHESMGNPAHAVLYPLPTFSFHENLTFVQRVIAWAFSVILQLMQARNTERVNELARGVFGDGVPDIYDLFNDVDMLFVNANPLFSAVRPHSPSTINLAGGVHLKEPQPLPKELQAFLDSGPSGVIYFSLGSNVKSKELSVEMRQIFLDTFSQLPYKILWKYEDDTLAGKPSNVHITKWAPQQDVLRHPNVKLFITQGGIQSLEEALFCHVPMLVLPFMADQIGNAAKVAHKQVGVTLDPFKLTLADFQLAIMDVIQTPKYRENVKQLAAQIQDEPIPPLEKAIWWIEYVLRHKGAQHLKGPIVPFYQYYYMDVWGILGAVFIALLSIIYVLIRLVIRRSRNISPKSKPKAKAKKA